MDGLLCFVMFVGVYHGCNFWKGMVRVLTIDHVDVDNVLASELFYAMRMST